MGLARRHQYQPSTVKSGESTSCDLEVYANPNPGLKGTVADEQGNPVEGAVVRLGAQGDVLDFSNGMGSTAYTDRQGRFEFAVAGNGLSVWARKGRLGMDELVQVQQDPRDVKLLLRKDTAGSITLKIVDIDGQPIAGAAITFDTSDLYQSYARKWGRTQPDGSYVISPAYPDRRYYGSIYMPGYAQGSFGVTTGARQSTLAKPIILRRNDQTITGIVIDEAGNLVPRVELQLQAGPLPAGIRTATSDADGRFKLDRLVGGQIYSVSARNGTKKPTFSRITAGTADAVITLTGP